MEKTKMKSVDNQDWRDVVMVVFMDAKFSASDLILIL